MGRSFKTSMCTYGASTSTMEKFIRSQFANMGHTEEINVKLISTEVDNLVELRQVTAAGIQCEKSDTL